MLQRLITILQLLGLVVSLCSVASGQDYAALNYPKQSLGLGTCSATATVTGFQKIWFVRTGQDVQFSQSFVHLNGAERFDVRDRAGIGAYAAVDTLLVHSVCREELCPTRVWTFPEITDAAVADAEANRLPLKKIAITNYTEAVDVVQRLQGAATVTVNWNLVMPQRITRYTGRGFLHAISFVGVAENGDIVAINPWQAPFAYHYISPDAVDEILGIGGASHFGFWVED